MLNLKLIKQIDEIAIELRRLLELPFEIHEFETFRQVTFGELAKKIMHEFQTINIIDDMRSDFSYMIKLKNSDSASGQNFEFEIHIGTEMSAEERIDSLMHEMAHFVLHADNLEPAIPIGRYKGSPIQEKEANCLSRAFLIPRVFFIKALTMFSRNDGSVDVKEMANYFKVQESLIIERGRDLMIWN